MKGNVVRHKHAPNAPLTGSQEAELAALHRAGDTDINLDEMPELDEHFWQNAVRNPYYKPTKTSTTMRLDSDVLAWFKQQGKGWQTRMNAVLRQEMMRGIASLG